MDPVDPLPVVVKPPELARRVQSPEGSPLKVMLPVLSLQFGDVVDSITGAPGGAGAGVITPGNELADIHPSALVTVKV